MRDGLDFYGHSSFASWFFRTSVVVSTFLVEANSTDVAIRFNADNVRKDQILLKDSLKQFLAEAGEIMDFDLIDDLNTRIWAAL